MYNSAKIALLLGSLFLGCFNIALSSEPAPHWYEVTIQHGAKPFEFYGSSPLKPEEFIKSLSTKNFVYLENLMFRQKIDGEMVYKNWKEWDQLKKEHIYLNSSNVIAVHPLEGKPGVK